MEQLVTGFLLACIIALIALKLQSLSKSGALAAILLGTIIFGLGGLPWTVVLLGFFVSASLLSKLVNKPNGSLIEKYAKGSQRDAAQVLANGGVGGLLVLIHTYYPNAYWAYPAFIGSMAAVNADTWATELGALSRKLPRLITTGQQVERGTSGGITFFGSLAAFIGALFIAILGVAFWKENPVPLISVSSLIIIFMISLVGMAGSMIDSLLGSVVQGIFFCSLCNKETERHPTHLCGNPTTLTRGVKWFNNDLVNLISSLSGALIITLLNIIYPLNMNTLSEEVFNTHGGDVMSSIVFSSNSFKHETEIPIKYSCEGDNISPELTWDNLPVKTKSLAIIMDDPDAPVGPFVHWVIYNISPSLNALPEGVPMVEQISGVGTQGMNGFRQQGYGGPCPPPGSNHRYYFKLYATDLQPDLAGGLSKQQLLETINGHIIDQSVWMGTFKR